MKIQVFMNVLYLHKNYIVTKLYFNNMLRRSEKWKFTKTGSVYRNRLDRFRSKVDQKVDILVQKVYKIYIQFEE